mgnify:CR=1 FL=1
MKEKERIKMKVRKMKNMNMPIAGMPGQKPYQTKKTAMMMRFMPNMSDALIVEAMTIVQRGTYIFVTRDAFPRSELSPDIVPSEKKLKSMMEVKSCKEKCWIPDPFGLKIVEKTKFKMRKVRRGFNSAQTYPKTEP